MTDNLQTVEDALAFYSDEKRYSTPLYDEDDQNNVGMPYPDKGDKAKKALTALREYRERNGWKENVTKMLINDRIGIYESKIKNENGSPETNNELRFAIEALEHIRSGLGQHIEPPEDKE